MELSGLNQNYISQDEDSHNPSYSEPEPERSAVRLSAILDMLPDACIAVDSDFTVRYANSRARKDFTHSHVTAPRIWDVLPLFVESRVEHELRRAIDIRIKETFDVDVSLTEDRTEARLQFFVFPDPFNDGLIICYRDITAEHQAQQKLKESLTLLSSIVEGTPDFVLAKDINRRYLLANKAGANFFGFEKPADMVGKSDHDIFTGAMFSTMYDKIKGYDDLVLSTGQNISFEIVDETSHRNGTYRALLSSKSPLRDPATGETFGLVSIVHDISEQKRRESRHRFVYEVIDSTRLMRNPEEILAYVLNSLRHFMCASRCAYLLVHEETQMIEMRYRSLRDESLVTNLFTPITALSDKYVSYIRSGIPIIINDTLADDVPAADQAFFSSFKARSTILVPVLHNGIWVGLFSINDDQVRDWDLLDVDMIVSLAERTWLTLENARLFRDSQQRAERESFLAETTRLLNQTLDYETTLATIAKLIVPRFADWCVVTLDGEDGTPPECVAVEHLDQDLADKILHLRKSKIPRIEAPDVVKSVFRTGKSEFTPIVTDQILRKSVHDDEYFELIANLGITSAMVVPIAARDRVYGALSITATSASGRYYTEDDLRLAEQIAQRAGTAIENALLYKELQKNEERQRRIADVLQTSLILSSSTDAFSGLLISSHYEAAMDEASIGGDYGDLFRLDDRRVALLVGDCSGKGLEAARFVSECQFTLRAFLRSNPDNLISAMQMLNEVLLNGQRLDDRPRSALTCLTIAVIDVTTGRTTIAAGGAEPPLLVRKGSGFAESIPVEGSLIGVDWDVEFMTAELTLASGDAIVLSTDGITEARRYLTREPYGYDRHATAVQEIVQLHDKVEHWAYRIVQRAKEYAGGVLTDDACVLIAQRA